MNNFENQLRIMEDRLKSMSDWGSRKEESSFARASIDEMMPEGFMGWMKHPSKKGKNSLM